jgi:hypothetical protein
LKSSVISLSLALIFCSIRGISPVLARSGDGTLNLSDFGASGSIRTMKCNVVARSSLLRCSGGDFRVGQTIRILAAGVSPTILAPSTPKANCRASNGGFCSGSKNTGSIQKGSNVLALGTYVTLDVGQAITVSGASAASANLSTTVAAKEVQGTTVVLAAKASTTVRGATVTIGTLTYGYKVAAIQNSPNGPITAVSAAQTVTQAAQVPSTTWLPNVGTTLSTSPEKNASYYVWYKSVAGSPYNFYVITPSNEATFSDTGDLAQGFTCIQLGVPCVAPSSTTPNDVFARITAIHGSTYTIAADPLPPKYWSSQSRGLPASTFPSTPAITANGVTVQHDDTPAFQAIYYYLKGVANPGYATVFIPPGDYNVYPADPSGGGRVFNVTGLKYVTIEGAGHASRLHDFGDRSNGQSSNFIQSQNAFAPGPGYALVDPANNGSQTVRLLNPANSSNFAVGEYVLVFINARVYPGNDYLELNRVISINATTGAIGLAYPLNKPYSVKLPIPYSECSTCVGSPRIAPLPHGPVATHIVVRNFWFEGPAYFLNVNTVDWVTTDNLWVHDDEFDSNGDARHRVVRDNMVIDEGNTTEGPSLGEGAAGSSDIQVEGNTYEVHGAPGIQACQEQTANVRWLNNRIIQVGTGPGNALLGGGDCYGWLIANNDISISSSNSAYVFGGFTPMVARITGNTIHVDNGNSIGRTYNGDPTNTALSNNKWMVGSGTLVGPQVSGTSTLTPYSSLSVPMPANGSIQLYTNMGYATVFTITMSRSVTSINLGSIRHHGLVFAIDFIQNGTGGFTLPAGTGQSQWVTGGRNVDFLDSAAPVLNPAPKSSTIVWFYDDGTTVHEMSTNYHGAAAITLRGTSGSAVCAETLTAPLKIGSCYLNGYRETGIAQTYIYPMPFSTAPVLLKSGGSCGTYNATTTATALTLPANGAMTAESCNITVLGQ